MNDRLYHLVCSLSEFGHSQTVSPLQSCTKKMSGRCKTSYAQLQVIDTVHQCFFTKGAPAVHAIRWGPFQPVRSNSIICILVKTNDSKKLDATGKPDCQTARVLRKKIPKIKMIKSTPSGCYWIFCDLHSSCLEASFYFCVSIVTLKSTKTLDDLRFTDHSCILVFPGDCPPQKSW